MIPALHGCAMLYVRVFGHAVTFQKIVFSQIYYIIVPYIIVCCWAQK